MLQNTECQKRRESERSRQSAGTLSVEYKHVDVQGVTAVQAWGPSSRKHRTNDRVSTRIINTLLNTDGEVMKTALHSECNERQG